MWVKICANTSAEDAHLASECGADALGFVFAPSARQVTPEQVRPIANELPSAVERVGVFPAWSAGQIAAAAATANLTAVQLHGGYDPELTLLLRHLLPSEVEIIQVVPWKVGEDAESAAHVEGILERIAGATLSSRVLIDAKVGSASGGTGQAFDWSQARAVFSRFPQLRLILAGGLRPENVRQAIEILQPWGVDVASGVESEPGRKDPARVRSFIEKARRV